MVGSGVVIQNVPQHGRRRRRGASQRIPPLLRTGVLGQLRGRRMQGNQLGQYPLARGGEALQRAAEGLVVLRLLFPLLDELLGLREERAGVLIRREVELADPIVDHHQGIAGRHDHFPPLGTTTSNGRTYVRSGSIS